MSPVMGYAIIPRLRHLFFYTVSADFLWCLYFCVFCYFFIKLTNRPLHSTVNPTGQYIRRYRHFWPLVNWMLEFYGKVNILRSHFKFPKIINDEMPLIHIDNFFNSYSLISFMLFQFFIYIHQRQPSASLAVTVYFTPIRMYL